MIKKHQGFSLLEVLVAFSIFTLSLGVIFQIYSKGTRSTVLSDEYSRAVIVAQSRLAGIGIEDLSDSGESSGVENNKYHWNTTISTPDDDDGSLETRFRIVKREVEVEVSWDSNGKTRAIKLNTLKIIPVS